MVILTGLTAERKLAGLAVLSGWLPLREKFKAMAFDHAASIPIFWAQGAKDPLVRPEMARRSADFVVEHIRTPVAPTTGELKSLEYHSYDGVAHWHSANQKELDDLKSVVKEGITPNHGVNP
ncbi:hypothetical protein DFH08DRAFT_33902 [Mycena albidolilacea]|uniref:Acyl-protein thioesterase 1 n=1 Tax=Mycena albidolilacea TaxID=1033008 RepID=A0AAD7AVM1_9AGAR|nr:hypothetical protein DFH08DRAFT_33902 [Mycena albidolilacea]